jgi:hypothetical protein
MTVEEMNAALRAGRLSPYDRPALHHSCHPERSRGPLRSSKSSRDLFHSEEFLDHLQVRSLFIIWQALDKNFPILFFQNPIVEQRQQSTIVQRSDQPSKSLLQRDDRRRNLILKERIPTLGINRFHPRRNYGITRRRKRQPVDDHATELLSLHVHSLPKRRSRK